MRLDLNVPVPPIPFLDKRFSKARDVKRLSNVTLNENSLGNLFTNLVTTDPPKPILAL